MVVGTFESMEIILVLLQVKFISLAINSQHNFLSKDVQIMMIKVVLALVALILYELTSMAAKGKIVWFMIGRRLFYTIEQMMMFFTEQV